jgi:hypothetical protein
MEQRRGHGEGMIWKGVPGSRVPTPVLVTYLPCSIGGARTQSFWMRAGGTGRTGRKGSGRRQLSNSPEAEEERGGGSGSLPATGSEDEQENISGQGIPRDVELLAWIFGSGIRGLKNETSILRPNVKEICPRGNNNIVIIIFLVYDNVYTPC